MSMAISQSGDFLSLVRTLFQQLAGTEAMVQFNQSNLVIRMVFEDIQAEILVDGRTGEIFWETAPGRADLELFLSGPLFHAVMMDTLSLRKAIMQGDIRSKGNVFRALSFSSLLQAARPVYRKLVATADQTLLSALCCD